MQVVLLLGGPGGSGGGGGGSSSVTTTTAATTTTTEPARPQRRLHALVALGRHVRISVLPHARKSVLIQLSCAGRPCVGRIEVTVSVRSGRRHVTVVIAAGSYRLQRGTSAWIHVPLTAAGARLLSQARGTTDAWQATARVSVSGGRNVSEQLTVG